MLPQANEVHIHCATLTSEVSRYVSSDEIERADRLLDSHKRMLSIASRGLLREIIGRYLRLPPELLYFSVRAHGKPFISADSANNIQLYFNLSHSDTLFLLAITTDREVGIDVEQIRDGIPFSDMARLAFSLREQEELISLPDHLQQSAFYRCWTRKEAYLKASGMGFSLHSGSFDVSLLPEPSASLMIAPDDLSSWYLHDICVPENYHAALAVKGLIPIILYIV
jgi:4'-phosphopantetheinyl transferase